MVPYYRRRVAVAYGTRVEGQNRDRLGDEEIQSYEVVGTAVMEIAVTAAIAKSISS